jgi:hypothetical protein
MTQSLQLLFTVSGGLEDFALEEVQSIFKSYISKHTEPEWRLRGAQGSQLLVTLAPNSSAPMVAKCLSQLIMVENAHILLCRANISKSPTLSNIDLLLSSLNVADAIQSAVIIWREYNNVLRSVDQSMQHGFFIRSKKIKAPTFDLDEASGSEVGTHMHTYVGIVGCC